MQTWLADSDANDVRVRLIRVLDAHRLTVHVVERFRALNPPPADEDVTTSLLIHWSPGGANASVRSAGAVGGGVGGLADGRLPFRAQTFGTTNVPKRKTARLVRKKEPPRETERGAMILRRCSRLNSVKLVWNRLEPQDMTLCGSMLELRHAKCNAL